MTFVRAQRCADGLRDGYSGVRQCMLGANWIARTSVRSRGAEMALFVGQHVNKIDKKGRVSVPKPFRNAMLSAGRAGEFVGIYAYPFFKYAALEACDEQFMQRLSDSLENNLDLFSQDQDDMAAITLETAHALSFDPEGRIALPESLMTYAGFDDQALFVGRGSRFQIWHPETYARERGDVLQRARTRGVTLKLSGSRNASDGEDS